MLLIYCFIYYAVVNFSMFSLYPFALLSPPVFLHRSAALRFLTPLQELVVLPSLEKALESGTRELFDAAIATALNILGSVYYSILFHLVFIFYIILSCVFGMVTH